MLRKKMLLTLIPALLIVGRVFGYGTGITTHPLEVNQGMFSTELLAIMQKGKGQGIQIRYTRKLNDLLLLDGGLGFSDSERSNRFFLGADIQVLPDYGKQPRVSLKATLENAKEQGARANIISLSPNISKGFALGDQQIYPFLAAPVSLALNTLNKQYELRSSASVGFTWMPTFEDFDKILVSTAIDINIKNAFTGVYLGVSYPIY